MNLYAESSAVLAWLLGEPQCDEVERILGRATRVVTSSLTAVECARTIGREHREGRLSTVQELAALRLLDDAVAAWYIHELSDPVLNRARLRFPLEPVGTLDAMHLATASRFQESLGQLTILTLDDRIRTNATGLGLEVLPE